MSRSKWTFFICIFFMMALLSCSSRKKSVTAIAVLTKGDVEIEKCASKRRPLVTNEEVTSYNKIITGENSLAAIQIGSNIIVKINGNSELGICSLFENGKKEIYLIKGTAVFSIGKQKKAENFIVNSNGIAASVRGTRFMVNSSDEDIVISVSEGAVYVTKAQDEVAKNTLKVDFEGRTIVKNKAIAIKESVKERGVLNSEKFEMEKITFLPLQSMGKLLSGHNDLNRKKYLKEALRLNKKVELSIIDQLKKKFGHVDIITLYNGKIIKGVITSRGKYFTIVTVNGRKKIMSKMVKRTRSLY